MVSVPRLDVAWRPHVGTYELRWNGACLFEGLRPEVVLTDGRELPHGDHGGLSVDATVERTFLTGRSRRHPAVLVSLSLRNRTSADVRVSCFRLFSAPAPGRRAIFRNGWQSWSSAGSRPIDRPDPDLITSESLHRHGHPRGRRSSPYPPPFTTFSDWLAVLDGEPWVTLGFVTGRDQFADIVIQSDVASPSSPLVTARCLADDVPLGPGKTLHSETLAILCGEGNPWEALETLAAETGRRAGHRSDGWAGRIAGRPSAGRPPDGWCTWYHYFSGISEEIILSDLTRLSALRPGLPLTIFQIDDGYQAAIGNWLESNPRFPRGMKWLAERVREGGFRPGLWLAPFSVMSGAPIFEDHPDWVIRDEAGRPVEAGFNWGGPFYGLDVTHPGVEVFLRELFSTVVRDWSYDYLKLDFIYSAALPGRRHDPFTTRAQALRRGLEIVRDTVPEAYVLACGSPLGPAVGLVDGMRIGPDVAPYWAAPLSLGVDPSFPSAVNSLRNVLARSFTHELLWDVDPDCLLVRDRDTQLTEAEVRSLASALALSGGSLFLSDAPEAIPADRLDLARRLLPPSGRPGVPVDPLGEEFPSVVVVDPMAGMGAQIGSATGLRAEVAAADPGRLRSLTIAFFNWSDAPATGPPVSIPELLAATLARPGAGDNAGGAGVAEDDTAEAGVAGDNVGGGPRGELAWHVFDAWERRYLGRFTEDVARLSPPDRPPHGCAVLGLVEHRRNLPTVVGCDRHLVQGPPLVEQIRTHDGDGLAVRIAPGGAATARVWVAVPLPFRPDGEAPAVEIHPQVWGQVLAFDVPLGPDGGRLDLRFSRTRITYT